MPLEQALREIATMPTEKLTSGLATALRQIGNAKSTQQHQKEAADAYRKSANVADRIHDHFSAAAAFGNLAGAQRSMDQLEESLATATRSIHEYQSSDAPSYLVAGAYNTSALDRKDLGDLEGSLADAKKAYELAKPSGNAAYIGPALNTLGADEWYKGHYAAGRAYFEEALTYARSAHLKAGEARLLNNIGEIYQDQGDLPLALDYLRQAVRIKEEIHAKDDLPTSLTMLALLEDKTGDKAQATADMDRAVALARTSGRVYALSSVLEGQGQLRRNNGDLPGAVASFKEALQRTEESSFRARHSSLLVDLAEVQNGAGDYAGAEQSAMQAVKDCTLTGLVRLQGQAESVLAFAQQRLGKSAEAREHYQKSIVIVEKMRGDVAGSSRERAEFFAHATSPYNGLIDLDVQQHRTGEAFDTAEKLKGRRLLDILAGGRVSARLSAREREEELRLRARVKAAELKENTPEAATSSAQRLQARREAAAARQAALVFHERLAVAHPELRATLGETPSITTQRAATLLHTPSDIVLEYAVTERSVVLFTVQFGGVLRAYTLTVTPAKLRTMVEAFHRELARRDPKFLQSADTLGQVLLAPAAHDLRGKTTALIVPDQFLWEIPFAALRDSQKHFLVEVMAVRYTPSLAVALIHSSAPRHSTDHTLLTVANPQGDLPSATEEANSIAALYRSSATTLVGKDATQQNILSGLAGRNLLHIATHAVLEDNSPMDSYLVLASTASGKPSQLSAEEIAALRIPVSLTVLSACDTAGGHVRNGEGIIGLSWAFLAAGSHGTIASEWSVESASTAQLMTEMHRQLLHGQNATGALRQSQLQLLRNPELRHPFYWAGFVLVGQD